MLELIRRQNARSDLPFAIIDLKSGNAVGTTLYMEIKRENKSEWPAIEVHIENLMAREA